MVMNRPLGPVWMVGLALGCTEYDLKQETIVEWARHGHRAGRGG